MCIYSSNRYTFVRIDTPYINYNSYICRRNNKNVIMTITEFFRAAPVLATILTLWKIRARLTPEGKAALTPENLFVLTPVKS